MTILWDAFLEDYAKETFDWSLRLTLEVFWYYCQDGNKAVNTFFSELRNSADNEEEKELIDYTSAGMTLSSKDNK